MSPSTLPFRSRFLLLWSAGVASVVLVLPYALDLQRKVLEALPAPLWVLAMFSLLQSALLLAVAVFVGLRAADAVGLRTPLTNAIAARAGVREALSALGPASAVAIGVGAAVLIVGLELVVFRPLTPEFQEAAAAVSPSRIEGFLASFYGGIGEEILTRLFLVSDLPAVASVSPLTAILVTRTIVLNSLAGIAFGWLYWRRGLEAAMIAHFSADLLLHVVVGG